MDLDRTHPASSNTQAITIPLHGINPTSSRRSNKANTLQPSTQRHRPAEVERIDSDTGNASESSLGSDWASSPTNNAHYGKHTRVGSTSSTTSPSTLSHLIAASSPLSSRFQRKDKQRAASNELPPNTLPLLYPTTQSPLGPSMLSSSSYKSINLNSHYDSESKEPARLITYTKHSQGFTWNDELFLPSYLLHRHRHRSYGGSGSRRRWGDDDDDDIGGFDEEGERCPVTDIFVTDEEAAAMMP